jgi:hypothetical protein
MHQVMQRASFATLLGQVRDETKLFVSEELELLKAELSEKAGHYRQSLTRVGIGAFVACAAFLVLAAGSGLLLSFVFQNLGLDLIPARSAGFGLVGLVLAGIGAVVAFKSIKALSRQSLAPEKTMFTVQRLREAHFKTNACTDPARPRHASKLLEVEVIATEQRLGVTLEELASRVSPAYYVRRAMLRVQAKPLRWNLAALAAGFAGSVWFVRKLKK